MEECRLALQHVHPSPPSLCPPVHREREQNHLVEKKKLSKAVNLMLGCSFTLTETISLGLSLGDSGFGASAGNVSPRELRASRDMEPP